MIKINNRLKQVSSFVNHTSSGIIDVGCDHALLDIYLKEKYKNLKVIASDINDGPLKKARENIDKYNMTNEIKLIKQDGIENIDKNIDTIIISGMGTENIIDILKRDINNLKHIKKIIISSNNKYYLLRKETINLGFIINKEKIVYEEDKFYIIIEFIKGKEEYSEKELYFGPYLLNNKDELFYKYYNNIRDKLIEVLETIPSGVKEKTKNIEKEIKLLTNELD